MVQPPVASPSLTAPPLLLAVGVWERELLSGYQSPMVVGTWPAGLGPLTATLLSHRTRHAFLVALDTNLYANEPSSFTVSVFNWCSTLRGVGRVTLG